MRDQPLVFCEQQGVAFAADFDAVHHAPELFERELADHPSGRLIAMRNTHRQGCGWQAVAIEAQRRD